MFANGQNIIEMMEEWAPRSYALPDDPGGLQIGTASARIDKVLVTLDVTEEVVQEAIREKARMIIAHHPPIFRPLRQLRTDSPQGKVLALCLKHEIAVYAAHTNLDIAQDGINDMLADALGLQNTEILEVTGEDKLFKFVVFIPTDHLESVRTAIFAAGAGHIGEYSHCSFNLSGTGTFLPGVETNPYIGQEGTLSEVAEVRMETIVPESRLADVVQAMTAAHPYEEPAYDIYPLSIRGRQLGLGRIGQLTPTLTLEKLADKVKEVFGLVAVRVVGNPDAEVRKVAVLGGSGRTYVSQAARAGADVLITGDIDYHTAHDALASGLSLIDPGHHVERIMIPNVVKYLRRKLQAAGLRTEVYASQTDTDPFRFR